MEPKDIVKEMRNELKLNRRQFCDYFCIPYRTVQDWECGKRVMPEYVLRLMEYKIRTEQMLMEKDKEKVAMKQNLIAKNKKKVSTAKRLTEKNEDVISEENDFYIRKMVRTDFDEAYTLCSVCQGKELQGVENSKEGMEYFLLQNQDTCFVAEQDGKIVGVLLTGDSDGSRYVYHLAILEEWRRKGVATQLVTAIESI